MSECHNLLIKDGTLLGEICHIEAAEQDGPRYNIKSNDEYRRNFQNLFLLCPNCHTTIDNNENSYPVALLTEWKKRHDVKFSASRFEISDELANSAIRDLMKQNNANTGPGTQINNQAKTQFIGNQIGTQNIHTYNQGNDKSQKPAIDGIRKVIPELKNIIDEFRQKAKPPDKTVIDFRNEMNDGIERDIELIPTKYLKFRKDNGRISSEIETLEKLNGVEFVEDTEETQYLLRTTLKELKSEDNRELKRLLKHKGQREPAIITCDGFLINGNRRKLALEELYQESGQDSKFESMRVVVLPEFVTVIDVQKIENRYQLQSEGKSEYHGLNRALTLRKNISNNFSLKAQLKDDPNYVDLEGKEFEKALRKVQNDFLNPLECVDRYLETFNRPGLYNTISEGGGDKEGRWQAFIDYSSFYYSTLNDPSKRAELNIREDEVGLIENAIFKIIRKRNLNSKELEKSFGKVHAFVRSSNLKKYLKNPKAKQYLLAIARKVDEDIPKAQKYSKDKIKYTEREIDEKWGVKFQKEIYKDLLQAQNAVNKQTERDKPLDLLEDALKKLNHKNLRIETLGPEHFSAALTLSKKITQKADEIHQRIDHAKNNQTGTKRNKRAGN